jgi:alpha/beta superfamily hydrolase
VCDYLLRTPPPGGGAPPPRRIVLIAYSYGSVVAANALAQLGPAAAAYVSIGFPLGRMARALLGSGAAWRALAAAQLPKLVIAGTRDEFTSPAQLRAAVAEHDAAVLAAAASASAASASAAAAAAAAGGGSDGGGGPSTAAAAAAAAARGGPYLVECELVDGADHFFHLLQDGVAAQVQAWLARNLAGSDEPSRTAPIDPNVK